MGQISVSWTNEYPNIFVTKDMDERLSEYIGHYKTIKNVYPDKYALEKKSTNIFAKVFICPKYLNIFEYQIICPKMFWTILAIFIFCAIFDPYLAILV